MVMKHGISKQMLMPYMQRMFLIYDICLIKLLLSLTLKKLKEFNPRYEGLIEQRFIKPTLKETIIELVKNGEVVKAYKLLIAIIKIYHLDCYELNGLIYHLRMNKKGIEIWNDPNYLGIFTETHVQKFGKSYFGNVGRCYSLESFMNILKARCLVFFLK